jgi:hypothetical protein
MIGFVPLDLDMIQSMLSPVCVLFVEYMSFV